MKKLNFNAIIKNFFLSILLASLSFHVPQSLLADQFYSSLLDDPIETYNFDHFQSEVARIRSQGNGFRNKPNVPLTFFHDEIEEFKKRLPLDLEAQNDFQELVDAFAADVGKDLGDLGGSSVLIGAFIHKVGLMPGIQYHGMTLGSILSETQTHMTRDAYLDRRYKTMKVGHTYNLPLAFAWIQAHMDPTLRQKVADRLLEHALTLDNTWFVATTPTVGQRYMAGLALWGLGLVDQIELNRGIDLFYAVVLGDTINAPLKVLNIAYSSIVYSDGMHWHGFPWMDYWVKFLWMSIVWRTATGEDYGQLEIFQNMPLMVIHRTGNNYEFQDRTQHSKDKWYVGSYIALMSYLVHVVNPSNPKLASLIQFYRKRSDYLGSSRNQILELIIPKAPLKTPDELGYDVTQLFKGSGRVLSRSSWEGLDATHFKFQAANWSQKDDGPVNNFSIRKNYTLFLGDHLGISGSPWTRQGGNLNNSLVLTSDLPAHHHITFAPRNAQNVSASINNGWDIRYDSLRKFTDKTMPGYSKGLRFFQKIDGADGFVYVFGDGGNHLFQSMTTDSGVLGGKQTVRLKDWTRQMIYFLDESNGSTYFVSFDRVDTGEPSLHAQLRYNFFKKPRIFDANGQDLGEGQVLYRGRDGGNFKYTNADMLVVDGQLTTEYGTGHGKMYMSLPPTADHFLMGGDDTRNIDIFHNLRNNGIDPLLPPNDPERTFVGSWRIQAKNKVSGPWSYLTTFEVADLSLANPSRPIRLESSSLIGTKISRHLVLFHQREETIQNGSVRAPSGIDGTFNLVISDGDPFAEYKINIGGREFTKQATATGILPLPNVSITSGDIIAVFRTGQGNLPPTVNAGSGVTITLPVNSLTLDGTVSDDGLPNPPGVVTSTWDKISGSGEVTFLDASDPKTEVSFSAAGNYILRITGSDSKKDASDTVKITVRAEGGGNLPPSVYAGEDQTLRLPKDANLEGVVSDDSPAGDLEIVWSEVSGPGTVSFLNINEAVTRASFSEPGIYKLQLSVSDGEFTQSDELTITVLIQNRPPEVNAGDGGTISIAERFLLKGQVSDDGIHSHQPTVLWSIESGPGRAIFADEKKAETTVHFTSPGTYKCVLEAFDGEYSVQDSVSLTVNPGIGSEVLQVRPNISRQGAPLVLGLNIPASSMIKVSIYSLTGGLVRDLVNGTFPSGLHEFSWDLRNNDGETVSTGIYLFQVTAGGSHYKKKYVVIR